MKRQDQDDIIPVTSSGTTPESREQLGRFKHPATRKSKRKWFTACGKIEGSELFGEDITRMMTT